MQELLPNGWYLSCSRLLDKCTQWDLMNTPIKIHEHNKINHKYCIHLIRRCRFCPSTLCGFYSRAVTVESSIYFTQPILHWCRASFFHTYLIFANEENREIKSIKIWYWLKYFWYVQLLCSLRFWFCSHVATAASVGAWRYSSVIDLF